MSEPVQSVLHEAQEARGATFRDDDGWLWTMGFGDGLAGYEAVTGSVAIWDVYPLVKWVVTGPDAAAAIQTVFSNDVGTQQVGQVKYGAFLADDGTMVDDGTVFKHAEDRFWVFSNTSGFGDHWRAQLGGLDVEIVNRLHELPLIAVQGPRSREVLQSLTDTDLSGLGYFRFLPDQIEVAGVRAWISRTGFTGELGFELVPDRVRLDHLRHRLHAGRAHAVRRLARPDGGAVRLGLVPRAAAAGGDGCGPAEPTQDVAVRRDRAAGGRGAGARRRCRGGPVVESGDQPSLRRDRLGDVGDRRFRRRNDRGGSARCRHRPGDRRRPRDQGPEQAPPAQLSRLRTAGPSRSARRRQRQGRRSRG